MAINLGNFGSVISQRADSPVAQADTTLGDALQKFGAFAGQMAAKEQQELDQSEGAKRTAQFEVEATELFTKGQELLNTGDIKPDEFETWYSDRINEVSADKVKGARPRLANSLTAGFDVAKQKLSLKVRETQAGFVKQTQAANFMQTTESLQRLALTDMSAAQAQFDVALKTVGPSIMTPEQIVKARNDFNEQTTFNNVASDLEGMTRIADISALESKLTNMDYLPQLSPQQRLQARNAAQSKKRELKAEYDRQKREREADAAQEGSMYMNMLGSGLPVSPQLQTQMANFAGGGSKSAKFVREGLANYGAIRAQQLSPFASQVADLGNLRAAVVNETNPERRITLQNRFDVLAKSYNQGAQAFKADSLQYAADVSGTVPPPIDLNSSGGFLASMRERANYVNRASATHGKPVTLMTAAEASQFVPMFIKRPVAEQADMLASIRKAGGDKAAMALAGSLSKEDPMLGLAAYHAAKGGTTTSGRSTAAIVLKGMKIDMKLPKDSEDAITEALLDRYGEALDTDSNAFNQYQNTAKLVYKTLSAEEGDLVGGSSKARAISAATIAVGTQPVSINGRAVIPPIGRGADEFKSSMTKGIAKIGRDVYGYTGSDLDKFITGTVLKPEGNETYGLYTKGSGATIIYPAGGKRSGPVILRGDK